MKKQTNKEFIHKAKQIHQDKYDYSKVNYQNARATVCIICHEKDVFGQEHGCFFQTPDNHLRGQGCSKCSMRFKKSSEDVKNLFQLKIDKGYDYSLIINDVYKNNESKLPIICHQLDNDGNEHGIFYQSFSNHMQGKGCPKCGELLQVKNQRKLKDHLNICNEVHANIYDYSLITEEDYKNCRVVVPIICKKHGIFYQTIASHKRGSGCPRCCISKGEKSIQKFLQKYNIDFIPQKKFKNCRNKLPLPFDFYLTDYNICIEYDGKQHFKPVQFGGMSSERSLKNFEINQMTDNIKNKYCQSNNIKLIRIKYTKFDKIEEILQKELVR